MSHTAVRLGLGLWLTLGGSAATAAEPAGGGDPLLDVPYVSQSELLCGGAAAAMILRHAGLRGVYAEDFSALVDRAAGGIRTTALAAALRQRGHTVEATSGSIDNLRTRLSRGQPVITLIEDRPGRFHYVVIVGLPGGAVVYHDPARSPFITASVEQFETRWRASGRWMLALEQVERPPAPRPPAVLVETTGTSPAMRLFLEREYGEAAAAAERAVTVDANDLGAWRLLGAARYLDGHAGRALDAWNRVDEPRVDLVRFDGVSRTPHKAAERLVGVDPGIRLTRSLLARADRRLALLPSRQTSRVTYVALPGGLAEVRGTIVERPVWPSRVDWLAQAARVPIEREVDLSVSNLAKGGERMRAAWRFWEGRRRLAFDLEAPLPKAPGVWNVSSSWQQETYADRLGAPEHRHRRVRLGWTDWLTARWRVSGGGGAAHWDGLGRVFLLDAGLELRTLNRPLAIEATVTGGTGARAFTSVSLGTRWQQRLAAGSRVIGTTSLTAVSSGTPEDLWPGAGTGQGRPVLLRAHPLLEAGAVAGEVFGRQLAAGTIEAQRDVQMRGLLTIGLAAFVDAARAWERPDGSTSRLHVDTGVGLRLGVPAGHSTLRVDLARGLRDGRLALSAGWQLEWANRD